MRLEPDYIEKLAKIITDNGLTEISMEDGEQAITIRKDLPEVIRFKEGTTEIAQWAFFNCKGLHEIILPESIQQIGDRAFEAC